LNNSLWDKSIMDLLKWGGKHYAVCSLLEQEMYLTFYNKTMFNKKGIKTPREYWEKNEWNWDTFYKAAKEMKEAYKDLSGFYACYTPKVNAWMLSRGVNFISYQNDSASPMKNNLADQASSSYRKIVEAWEWYNKLNTEGLSPIGGGERDSMFTSGKLGMYSGGAYLARKQFTIAKNMTDDWDGVPFPGKAGESYSVPMQHLVWCIPVGAKNPQGAGYYLLWSQDETNYPSPDYAKPQFKSTIDAMNQLPKTPSLSQGILGADKEYQLWGELTTNPGSESVIFQQWKPRVDAEITRVFNELPKK